MAEILKEIQERDLPEYEAIKSSGICTEEELHKLMRERERFETKIIQSKKSLVNYIEYIQFEKNTHKWVMEKEKQLHCTLPDVKRSIIQRIIKLYRNGTQQFPQEERLWKSFIQFSKKSNPGQVAGIYEKMLAYHGDKDAVWCDFALWAYESTKILKTVTEIFLRALKRNPTSEVLNLAFFDILIKETARITDVSSTLNVMERQLGLERALLLYRNNRSKITNVSYYLKLLERCEEPEYVNCTALLQKEIVEDIMKYFFAEPSVWDYLAQRELRGYNIVDLQEVTALQVAEIKDNQMDTGDSPLINENIWKHRNLKVRIELCFKAYEKAVEVLPNETMWSYFINAMLDLNQDMSTEGDMKRYCLSKAFNMGHKSQLMSVTHYKALVEMLLKSPPNGISRVETILQEVVEFKNTVEIYELWMQVYSKTQNEARFYEIFIKANKELGFAKCVSLWHLAIKFYEAYYDEYPKKLHGILQEAAKQIHPEFGVFRAYLVEYTMRYETLKKARELYDELCQIPPPCLELHRKMAEIEKQAKTKSSDISRMRLCYENAVHYFGKSYTDVWIELLKFERDLGDFKKMSPIYDRAKSTLNPDLVDSFISEYSLLKVLS
ncbi:U3 small nucleolar RNA-associated protein 6 homolog [Stomoxys calcitrans]|uniref:U3 small nucleolar RNA-associated protein 6 homolog n=1 Tax=Stomoxys calcitrans TaxID=35570 RepID=UPI0027E39D23|nr:U3 small nucleolar RNA-associated protein 6 homolog [Stomoxys calcitrans]